jgi:hypothetical protein
MQRHLVISVDYEIFGNGTGDVRQHMTEPTERMARFCETHQMPLTVFFEVEEYLAFQRCRGELQKFHGYDPAALIRDQIISLAKRGHDIQLHLHPEWYGARWDAGQWVLNEAHQTVDSLFETEAETMAYIAERKAVIDELLEEAGSSERVHVYRAGAFSAQPGAKLLEALAGNEIWIDSSVVQGLTRRNPHVTLDYRKAPCRKGPWRVSRDVALEDRNGALWEFPIYSEMGRRWHQATFGRIKAKFSRNVPKAQQQRMARQLGLSRNPVRFLRFLFEPVPIKLDFHNLSPAKLLQMICSAPKAEAGLPDVLVLIGHSKEHVDDRAFEQFLRLVNADAHLKVIGFGQIAEMVAPAEIRR